MAQQTGLDRAGVPCYAAIRPNARTLAVNQGKGGDDCAAKLSAIMEAVEFAVAEAPAADRILASMDELVAERRRHFVPTRLLPRGHVVEHRAQLTWIEGRCLGTGEAVLVPIDSVALAPNATEALPFAQSSNGLGAGFAADEAAAHALCELIERDAYTLWSLQPSARCAATELSSDLIDRCDDEGTVRSVRGAGFDLKLFDLTNNLGMPVIMALLWRLTRKGYLDVASGVCAHLSTARAVAGAVQEAAQTRISNIAGARDDIDPADYNRSLPSWIGDLLDRNAATNRELPASLTEDRFAAMPMILGGRTIVVPLDAAIDPVRVVKILSDSLEDRSTNAHWRPGRRAIMAMTTL